MKIYNMPDTQDKRDQADGASAQRKQIAAAA